VEVHSLDDALKVTKAGIDVVQLDNFSPADVRKCRKEISKSSPAVKLAAAGNIVLGNIADYARSGADILVTSWPYYGEPAGLAVSIQPIYDLY
jgi:molybdenum transport protein